LPSRARSLALFFAQLASHCAASSVTSLRPSCSGQGPSKLVAVELDSSPPTTSPSPSRSCSELPPTSQEELDTHERASRKGETKIAAVEIGAEEGALPDEREQEPPLVAKGADLGLVVENKDDDTS